MLKKIPIGTNSFSKLVHGDYYFVDKTLLIKEFLDKSSEVTLVTRSRRFGKTINMSMLAEFFDITKDSKKLFEGTKIMDTPYASEMNQYPVIYMTFADAKNSKDKVVKYIKYQLKHEYERYRHIFENIDEHDRDDYNDIMEGIRNKRNGRLDDVDDAKELLS